MNASTVAVLAAPYTIACWFWTAQSASDTGLFSLYLDLDNYSSLMTEASGDKIRWYVEAAGVSDSALTGASFTLSNWHHACGVEIAANSRAVFLNGASKATNATNLTPTAPTTMQIGSIGGVVRFASGPIFLPAVWDCALTDFEVWQLAQGVLPWRIRPQSLMACWDALGRNLVNNRFQMTAVNSPGFSTAPPKFGNEWISPFGRSPAAPAVGPILTTYAGYSVPVS